MRAEVAVVGGGIIGALAAYELRKRGLEVLLLEAGKRGAATAASAGMLAPHAEGLRGEALGGALFGLEYYPELLRELGAQGFAVEAAFSGTYVAAPSEGEAPYPLRDGRGARLLPGGYVNPQALRRALLAALAAMGVGLEEAEALGVEGKRVLLKDGERRAQRVLLAVGAWGERFGLGVRPLKGEALVLEAPAPPAPLFAGDGYLLPRGGGVYLGATAREGWAEGVELAGLKWLADYAQATFPLLERARLTEALWGFRPAGELFIGEVDEGVFAAVGHGRNGVLLAPWTARRVLELLGVEA